MKSDNDTVYKYLSDVHEDVYIATRKEKISLVVHLENGELCKGVFELKDKSHDFLSILHLRTQLIYQGDWDSAGSEDCLKFLKLENPEDSNILINVSGRETDPFSILISGRAYRFYPPREQSIPEDIIKVLLGLLLGKLDN